MLDPRAKPNGLLVSSVCVASADSVCTKTTCHIHTRSNAMTTDCACTAYNKILYTSLHYMAVCVHTYNTDKLSIDVMSGVKHKYMYYMDVRIIVNITWQAC